MVFRGRVGVTLSDFIAKLMQCVDHGLGSNEMHIVYSTCKANFRFGWWLAYDTRYCCDKLFIVGQLFGPPFRLAFLPFRQINGKRCYQNSRRRRYERSLHDYRVNFL